MRPARRATSIWCRRRAAVEVNGVRVNARDGVAIRDEATAEDHRAGRFRTGAGRRGVSAASRHASLACRASTTSMPGTACEVAMPLESGLDISPQTPEPQRRLTMSKVLVLYYSAYGHIETMAKAVAEGAREAGATRRHQARARTGAGRRSPRRRITSSTRRRRSRRSRISPIMTRSSSAPAPASAACRRRWRISSIRPAACGPRAR